MDTVASKVLRLPAFRTAPFQRGRWLHSAFDCHICRNWRRQRNARHGHNVQRSELGRIVKINPVNRIAIDAPILGAQILMLAVIMLIGFHDPHARNADSVKRAMVSAASEPVEPVDHHHIEIGNVLVSHAVDIAGEITRRAIDLAAGKPARTRFFGSFDIAGAFGEDARRSVIDHAINAGNIADHVIIDDAFDIPAYVQGMFGNDLPAKQSLFFTRQAHIYNRARKLVFRQNPRRFNRARHAGRIVIRAGAFGGAVKRICHAAINVARHNNHPVRVERPALDRHNAHHLYRIRNTGFAGNRIRHIHHFEAPAALGRNPLELSMNPAPRRANTVRLALGFRQSMPRTKADKLANISLNPVC